ncbi:MAG: 30S ribosomal protein S15 [Candidatus Lindowbacteria bacterium]|nr:30S ribosomal protein S15 [Candidatus Lindowbacteria bacterium]
MATTEETGSALVDKVRKHEKDTGSAEVQVALLTNRINTLADHFSEHKKDHHSRKGLLQMIGRRRKLLDYLKKTEFQSYKNILKVLKLRK